MPRIDLPEPYAVRMFRQSIRDSLMSHGEECVLMHTYHVNDDIDTQPRCPACFVNPAYEQGKEFDCPTCYGTGFQDGIKAVWRAWGMFTDAADSEDFSKRGIWHPEERSLQTEHEPDLWQRDFVARVDAWDITHRVESIEGIYVMKDVTNESLRTGNQPGQVKRNNVAQRCDITRLADNHPIYRYPLVGKVFARYDGQPR